MATDRNEHEHQDYEDGEQPGEDEAGRIEYLGERFGRIEAEQAAQRGILEQISDALAGRGPAKGAHDKAEGRVEGRLAHPPAQSIAEQVRAAVREVGAEEAQKARDAEHAADHERMRELAERPPRESMTGWRGKLAGVMYGADR